ncbi:MAG: HNH endonuclease, partial [Clostridia bacterium]|nr:HNH endonuclease [Clostridia bacterium]
TIEHVLPQAVDIASDWAKKWVKEEDRKFWLHRIANLVPLTRRKNSEAQNYDFDIKKSKYFYSSKGISSYALTSQVLATKDWTLDIVKERQKNLMDVFKDKWELN